MKTTQGITVTTQELLALRFQAQKLSLPSLIKSKNAHHGSHRSARIGRGMEFDEVRHYQHGDDIRSLDWKVTARTGKPHTKLFVEERDRNVMFLVDLGPHMHFGTRVALKSVIAAQVATLLAWTANQQSDKVGAILSAGSEHHEYHPKSRQEGVLNLISGLVNISERKPQAHSPSDLSQALRRLNLVTRPGSLLFLISDFYQRDDQFDFYLSLLAQHNSIIAISITDQLEHQLPKGNRLAFSDGSQQLILNANDNQQRRAYADFRLKKETQLKEFLTRLGIGFCPLQTHDDMTTSLINYLGRTYFG